MSGDPGNFPRWLRWAIPLILIVLASFYALVWWVINPNSPEQRAEVVKTFTQIVGGLAVTIGVYFTWKNFEVNQKNQRINEQNQMENQKANRERERLTQEAQKETEQANRHREDQARLTQLELEKANRLREQQAQEEHRTERFAKAVEQLGNERIEVNLGGIYSLERLAKDSSRDYGTVIEVLTAYVRERARLDRSKSLTGAWFERQPDGSQKPRC